MATLHQTTKFIFGLLLCSCMFVNFASADLILDGSFESIPAGNVVADGPDSGQWASFGGGFSASSAQALTGGVSVLSGGSGSFSNLRQSYNDSASFIEQMDFNYSAWFFYDPSLAGNETPGDDSINFQIFVTNPFNVHRFIETVTVPASSLTPNTWTEVSGTFNSGGPYGGDPGQTETDTLRVVFSDSGAGGRFYIDDVSLAKAVPEPTSCALLFGLGAIGLIRRQRRLG